MKPKRRKKRDPLNEGEPSLLTDRRRLRGKIAVLIGATVAVAALLAFSPPGQQLTDLMTPDSQTAPRAAILDQLDLTFPNPDFARASTSILEQAGYAVDYYRGPEVTVELYRNLPKEDYDLVILRVHAGLVEEIDQTSGSETLTDYVSLFTGELYSDSRYVEEVKTGPLGIAMTDEGAAKYFGIGPQFIESRMNGEFDDTTMILMGCDGLRSDRTARAFVDRGVKTFISWDKPVSATHTDEATEALLRHLLIEELPAAEAVQQTMAEVGPDPTFESELRFYPPEEES